MYKGISNEVSNKKGCITATSIADLDLGVTTMNSFQ